MLLGLEGESMQYEYELNYDIEHYAGATVVCYDSENSHICTYYQNINNI